VFKVYGRANFGSLRFTGLNGLVLTVRADAADMEALTRDHSIVADARASRLGRPVMNRKDFKVQTKEGWKRGKPFTTVVCPLHRLPSRNGQIHWRAGVRHVRTDHGALVPLRCAGICG